MCLSIKYMQKIFKTPTTKKNKIKSNFFQHNPKELFIYLLRNEKKNKRKENLNINVKASRKTKS
jgi:hypothetical protein